MRNVVVLTIIAVVFAFLTIYILNYQSPVDTNKLNNELRQLEIETESEFELYWQDLSNLGLTYEVLNIQVLFTALFTITVFVVASFSVLHLLIDKLFVKKYYQQPDLWPALRRGFFLGIYVSITIILSLLGALSIINILLVIVILVILELISLNFSKIFTHEN